MKKISTVSGVAATLLAALFMAPAHAAWELNMPKGVTDMTHEVWGLHMMIFWVCVALGVGVFGVMLYSIIRHRKSRGVEAANFHESTVVEIIWTIIPFIILIAVAIPSAGTLLRVENSDNADLTIRVTGYQWLWEYEYVDSGVHFYSRLSDSSMRARGLASVSPTDVDHYLRSVDNRLVVPKGKKVRLLLTSGDVIHAWWVPQLSGKKDAVPGYINDIWFNANKTGVYRGQCAELCGRGHGFMPIVVEVVTQDQFKAWIAKKTGGDKTEPSQAQQAAPAGESSGSAATTAATDTAAADTSKSNTPKTGAPTTAAAVDQAATEQDDGATAQQKSGESQAAPSGDAETASNDDAKAASGDTAGKSGKSELMALGEKVYASRCAACHKADGSGMASVGFPALTGSSVATGPVTAHIGQVLHGSGAMPPFASTLSDKQIAAVVTYERNALGNSTGDVVQPADVASQR